MPWERPKRKNDITRMFPVKMLYPRYGQKQHSYHPPEECWGQIGRWMICSLWIPGPVDRQLWTLGDFYGKMMRKFGQTARQKAAITAIYDRAHAHFCNAALRLEEVEK